MTAITSVRTLKQHGYAFSPLGSGGEKNKSLSTLLVAVKKDGKSLVCKVFFKNTPEGRHRDNSLPLERRLYKRLLHPLFETRVTPNLLRYYGSFSEPFDEVRRAIGDCASVLDKLRERVQTKEIRDHGTQGIRIRDIETLTIIGLEHVRAQTLRRWLQTERSDKHLRSVLFQIIYTAECLYRAGIRHNDLHIGNVLIDSNNRRKKIYYQPGADQFFAVPVQGCLVKLCDFDNACGIRPESSGTTAHVSQPLYINHRLKYYKLWQQYGMTDVDNPRYDTFTLLSSIADALKKHHGKSRFADLITKRFIPSPLLLLCPWKFAHRMGKKKDGTFFHPSQNSDCSDYVPSEEEVRCNINILRDDSFADWRISHGQFNALSIQQRAEVYQMPARPGSRMHMLRPHLPPIRNRDHEYKDRA